jgi:hypothetical protein
VGWFTRRVAPLAALRLDAARGSRDALRSLEAHDPAWVKIRAGNEPQLHRMPGSTPTNAEGKRAEP